MCVIQHSIHLATPQLLPAWVLHAAVFPCFAHVVPAMMAQAVERSFQPRLLRLPCSAVFRPLCISCHHTAVPCPLLLCPSVSTCHRSSCRPAVVSSWRTCACLPTTWCWQSVSWGTPPSPCTASQTTAARKQSRHAGRMHTLVGPSTSQATPLVRAAVLPLLRIAASLGRLRHALLQLAGMMLPMHLYCGSCRVEALLPFSSSLWTSASAT